MAATFVGDTQKQCGKEEGSCISKDWGQGAENLSSVTSMSVSLSPALMLLILSFIFRKCLEKWLQYLPTLEHNIYRNHHRDLGWTPVLQMLFPHYGALDDLRFFFFLLPGNGVPV